MIVDIFVALSSLHKEGVLVADLITPHDHVAPEHHHVRDTVWCLVLWLKLSLLVWM